MPGQPDRPRVIGGLAPPRQRPLAAAPVVTPPTVLDPAAGPGRQAVPSSAPPAPAAPAAPAPPAPDEALSRVAQAAALAARPGAGPRPEPAQVEDPHGLEDPHGPEDPDDGDDPDDGEIRRRPWWRPGG